ncbi:endo alpha-1,4 polygalactosaminidase [Pistricoccus aurantiacus]|uniref:endo alpha-1,4 polygalactosaminidase n=1 Tax=Pistricoccus aurantiacus TaxID=1883414 RepID=UPI0036341B8F
MLDTITSRPAVLIPLLASLPVLLMSCDDSEYRAMPVYNQAYQQNYEADQIPGILDNARNAYVLIDPFDGNNAASVDAIKQQGNEVGAYISIGTGETYRDDFSAMRPFLVSEPWDAWSDEYFVNRTDEKLLNIMKTRIDKIADWGFDWVEFDNMDWFYDDKEREVHDFQVTRAEGINYYRTLCDHVHSKNMKCMAKNTVEGATNFDGVTYESYPDERNWWDQTGAQDFLDAGKLVIINHYNEENCAKAYRQYKEIYSGNLSFICEDAKAEKYVHFNQ